MVRRTIFLCFIIYCLIVLVTANVLPQDRRQKDVSHGDDSPDTQKSVQGAAPGNSNGESRDSPEVRRNVRAPPPADPDADKSGSKPKVRDPPPEESVKPTNAQPPVRPRKRYVRKSRRRQRMLLRNSKECSQDIQQLCPKSQRVDNFVVIDCLQRDTKTAESVSDDCQHLIWQFKRNMTKSSIFEAASNRICVDDFKNITECDNVPAGSQRVACLFEYKDKIQVPECLTFLNKVGTVLFSDYHLIYKFEQECGADISKLKCGRLSERASSGSDEKVDMPSSQGRTIECLVDNVDKLTKNCNHEILRVAELQADDFHLDRPLFFACRDDREKFCENVHAGQGRVYKCLMKNLQEETMTSKCKKELRQRMRLREQDYKIDYSFAGVCAKDVAQYKCASAKHADMMRGGMKPMAEAMSHVILCLENALKEDNPVTAECQSEMLFVRKQLMSDYQLTPEIVLHCSEPVQKFCNNGLAHKGRTLHCLMSHLKGKTRHPDMDNYPKCKEALHVLVQVADAGSDYRVDPVIMHNCQDDITRFCDDEINAPRHDGAIYSCLLKNLDAPKMTAKCSQSLLELQYIVSRDFKLDPQLYKKCKKDAAKICKVASVKWYTGEHRSMGGVVFSCLFNQLQLEEEAEENEEEDEDDVKDEPPKNKGAPKRQISKECGDEVLRVMRERSSQMTLNPFIYSKCIPDLANRCAQQKRGHNELECLQDNFDDLQPECAKVVRQVSEEMDRHPSLDVILSRSCAPMIHTFCQRVMKDVSQIMPCLIKHKDHPDMVKKCRAGIEHHQIISLKDFRISTAFRRGCARDLQRLCQDITKKSDAVICLSEYIRNATLLNKDVPLSKGCRQQVRFENFAKSEDIRLSPRIQRHCRRDIEQYCSTVPPNKHIACLRRIRWRKLTKSCQKALFDRRQLESYDSRIDARLQRVCKPMILHYCRGQEVSALDCLWQRIHDDHFDPKCRRVVYLRLETRVKDYRLDPLLNQLCKRDMRHYCVEFMDPKQNMTGTDYRNRMLMCLKARFKNYELSSTCQGYMRQLIVEINLNHHLDANLRSACTKDVQRQCSAELESTEEDAGDGRVTECLKRSLQNNKIKEASCQKEVLRLMDESRADVHVDPVLYKSCLTELNTICGHVQLGNGRQMSCLLWAKEDKEARKGMSFTCRKQVQLRLDMWEKAARAASPNTLHELAIQVNTSDSRHFFFAFFAFIVLAIFIFGLCCGRVSKRVYIDAKNK